MPAPTDEAEQAWQRLRQRDSSWQTAGAGAATTTATAAPVQSLEGYDPETGLRKAPPLGAAEREAVRAKAEQIRRQQEHVQLQQQRMSEFHARMIRPQTAPRVRQSDTAHDRPRKGLAAMFQPGRTTTVGGDMAMMHQMPDGTPVRRAIDSVVTRYASFDERTNRHRLTGPVGRYPEFAIYREESRAHRQTGAERMGMDAEAMQVYEQTVFYYALLKETEAAIANAKHARSLARDSREIEVADRLLWETAGRYDQFAMECAQRAETLMQYGHNEIQEDDFSLFSPASIGPGDTRVPTPPGIHQRRVDHPESEIQFHYQELIAAVGETLVVYEQFSQERHQEPWGTKMDPQEEEEEVLLPTHEQARQQSNLPPFRKGTPKRDSVGTPSPESTRWGAEPSRRIDDAARPQLPYDIHAMDEDEPLTQDEESDQAAQQETVAQPQQTFDIATPPGEAEAGQDMHYVDERDPEETDDYQSTFRY